MELGKRLKQARLELGLSQRALCGDAITRNMLSQIENGAARPSMETLRYLAGRLGKSVSYFLEEDAVMSPNQTVMEDARQAFRAGEWQAVLAVLKSYRGPDPLFDQEAALLRYLALTAQGEKALAEGRRPYAVTLLEQAGEIPSIYITAQTERRRLTLLARAKGEASLLPGIDDELLVRAELALGAGDHAKAAALLDSAADHAGADWNLLRGRAHLGLSDYAAAAACLHRAEEAYPAETAPLLEQCYRELEDFKMAYFYACKQR